MTAQNSKKAKIVNVYVDYWTTGLWGGWIRHTKGKPNVVDMEPGKVCDVAREFLAMHGQKPKFVFSEAVCLLHQLRTGTIG